MSDPHVEELLYRFITDNPNDLFEEAEPLTKTLNGFDLKLERGILLVKPNMHFSSLTEAREFLEPVLRAWEVSAFLSPNRFRIRFTFKGGRLVDRNPDQENVTLALDSASAVVIAGNVTITRSANEYPAPSNDIKTSSLIDDLIYRLQRYRDGREELPTVAFIVLDRLEQEFYPAKIKGKKQLPKRTNLAQVMNVDIDVLEKLGRLSCKPDKKIGRHAGKVDQSLLPSEIQWMDEVIFRLVNRIGEMNAGITPLKKLMMSDFPNINII